MKPGRELDLLIAEKVMGYDPIENMVYDAQPPISVVPPWRPLPYYSTDIAAAWEVVEKMREESVYSFIDNTQSPGGKYFCSMVTIDKGMAGARAATAPHAICLAALRAKGVEV